MFTPNSEIRLLSVPLTMGDGKQLDFNTISDQTNYFNGKTQFTRTNYNYQRQDRAITIDIPGGVDALMNCNYVMYQNKNFTNKWFYAFITRKEWVSENAARLYLKTDVFQTWLFDFKLMPSMVEREHTPTDGYYEHTLPENLPTGDLIEVQRINVTNFDLRASTETLLRRNYFVAICMSEELPNLPNVLGLLGGMPRTAVYYGIELSNAPVFFEHISADGLTGAIINAYLVPKDMCSLTLYNAMYHNMQIYAIEERGVQSKTIQMAPNVNPEWLEGIQNKKCLCAPYHTYKLWTTTGNCVELEPQNFNRPKSGYNIYIETFLNASTNCSLYCIPLYYKTTANGYFPEIGASYDYAVEYSEFPQLPWKSNFYENYMALNKSQMQLKMLAPLIEIGKGIAGAIIPGSVSVSPNAGIGMNAGSIDGASVFNGAMQLAQFQAQISDMKRIPDKINGTTNGAISLKASGVGIFISEYRVRDEYWKIIDQYFTMYGYKVMTLKTPQFKSRKLFNYLKTAGIDISGNIPQEDLQELRAMFDNGITVWHSGNNFGNYTGNNSPKTQ